MSSRRTSVLAAILAVGCGRVGFDGQDAIGDTAAPSDGPSSVRFRGGYTGRSSTTADLDVPIAPTDADLYVVAVATWSGRSVVSITDTGDAIYRPVFDRAADPNGTASELWYANGVHDTAAVTVHMSTEGAEGFDVWVGLFSGVDPSSPARSGSGCTQYPPDIQEVPLVADPGTLVVATAMFQSPVYIDAVAAPFIDIGEHLDGNGAAYVIADTSGTYAPAWHISAGEGASATICSSAAAFPPMN